MDSYEEHRKLALIVCLPCRQAKRKCEGGFPCSRCREREIEDECHQVFPKKRGRKPRADSVLVLPREGEVVKKAKEKAQWASSSTVKRKERKKAPKEEDSTGSSTAPSVTGPPNAALDASFTASSTSIAVCAEPVVVAAEAVELLAASSSSSSSPCDVEQPQPHPAPLVPSQGCQGVYHVRVNAELPHKYEFNDIEMSADRAAMMRLLSQCAPKALVERPKDVAVSFGADWLASSDYICVQMPPKNTFADVLDAFLHGRVVSAVSSEQHKFPQIFLDPRVCVGRRIIDMASQNKGAEQREMMRICFRPSAAMTGKAFIRRMQFPKTIFSELYSRPVDVLLESTMFMDDEAYPNWIFITILDVLSPPPPPQAPASPTFSLRTSAGKIPKMDEGGWMFPDFAAFAGFQDEAFENIFG